ncbi:MAG: ATP-binding protein [Pseudomonadota bacterium]
MSTKISVKPLPARSLRRLCETTRLPFKTTAELDAKEWLIGQERALEAISFGAGVDRPGYNIFAISPWQSGHLDAITSHLETLAADQPAQHDWAYIHNFDDPRCPRALRLPAGEGRRLARRLDDAIVQLRRTVPLIFSSDEYRARIEEVEREMNDVIQNLQDRAEANSVAIMASESGLRIVPVSNGRPVSAEELGGLSPEDRRRLEIVIEELQDELDRIVERLPEWEREARERVEELKTEVASRTVEYIVGPVREAYSGDHPVADHLDRIYSDMIENIEVFAEEEDEEEGYGFARFQPSPGDPCFKYRLNVIVDQSETGSAPVILDDHPTYGSLVGVVEQSADLGSPTFDFLSIKPGLLHQAAGGFLVIDVEELLTMPLAWEALKRALKTGAISIDTPRDFIGDVGMEKLEPEPIPVTCKVILIGDRFMHYRMTVLENDFSQIFRVIADFNDEMPWTDENVVLFAGLVARIADRDGLMPFDRMAIGRLVEEGSRLSEDAEKLSLMIGPLSEIMGEADHRAALQGRSAVTAQDVDAAVYGRMRRGDLLKERSHEYILREFIQVQTDGMRVGQVNGLVVTGLDQLFGRPSRITATVRMGQGNTPEIEQIVDIQKEVEMGGASHSKGVMILGAYLRANYSPNLPLCLSASLAFEQSYSFVDGDSASVAELCALLSALAGVPINQAYAITGAISQMGEVQTIGAVNEKIEGYFDICSARGLTGRQGVLIPKTNVKDLMLRRDVVAAVEKGRFAVYAVDTVNEALEILTGMPAGSRGRNGSFPKGSINRAVEDTLSSFAKARFEAEKVASKVGRSVFGA